MFSDDGRDYRAAHSSLDAKHEALNQENTVKLYRPIKLRHAPSLAFLALALAFQPLEAQLNYRQKNLVSDLPGLAAHHDSNLVNPWGVSSSASSPFWVSNAGTGTSTLYNSAGTPLPLVVTVPGVPTGQLFNTTTSFNSDSFIFASATGSIAGWRGALGTTAETLFTGAAGSSFLGVALGTIGSNNYLYAANFAQKSIAVFPGTGSPALTGNFTDPNLPSDYSPFNIQNVGGSLFVAYSKLGDDGDEVKGAGNGFVDKYDLNGNFLQRIASNGVLNAPWAVTLAPQSFGQFGGDLLVGNFGDGTINAFDPTTGDLLGTLKDDHGQPLVNSGLWGLRFGNGGSGGDPNTLYFAAGIDDEQHGLFGSFTPVPEAATTGVCAALALVGLCALAHHRRRKTSAAAALPAGAN